MTGADETKDKAQCGRDTKKEGHAEEETRTKPRAPRLSRQETSAESTARAHGSTHEIDFQHDSRAEARYKRWEEEADAVIERITRRNTHETG